MRIWNAGCSTGEETFSLAILLREEGLYDRTRIYATDINDQVLERARAGSFPLEKMREYTENYLRAGGSEAFSSYYTVDGGERALQPGAARAGGLRPAQPRLRRALQRVQHDHLPQRDDLLRQALQDRVHELFYESLDPFGILALGHKESIKFTQARGALRGARRAAEKLYGRSC